MSVRMIGRRCHKLLDLATRLTDLGRGDATDRERRRFALKDLSDFQALEIFAQFDLTDHERAVRRLDDEPFAFEPLQRFAERRARDAEDVGELRLDYEFPAPKATAADHLRNGPVGAAR